MSAAMRAVIYEKNALYLAFGEAVFNRRRFLGITQLELSRQIGLSRPAVANIETGRQNVLLHAAVDIADALDTTLSELLAGHTDAPARHDVMHVNRANTINWPPAPEPILIPPTPSQGKDLGDE